MTLRRIRGLVAIFLIILSGCSHKTRKVSPGKFSINDFSRLNKTPINKIATPSSYEELQSIIQDAQSNGLKISIAGTRHSQGGHAFYPNAIVISLKKLNKVIDFDAEKKLITIQTGITWKEIQEYLHPHQLAVKIMQFANLFTVGGALSVNCNGIDPSFGPLIESIRSIKILLANGSIATASRSINPELFSLAIGGYGLFGIILEATIEVVEDSLYKRQTSLIPLTKYANEIQKIAHDPEVGFHLSFLTLTTGGRKLFGDVAVFNFKKYNATHFSNRQHKTKRKLFHQKFVALQKIGINVWAHSRLVKALHWIPEGLKHGQVVSRNNIMRPPASHLYVELSKETNLLQEYFIPVNNLVPFISELESITTKLHINLMHVALRFIPQNTESYLSYTKTDRIGIVLFFNQKMTPEGNRKTKQWTKYLINTAARLKGAHYLPIQLHANKNEVLKVYPEIDNFFELKKKYDSRELFMNHFYKKYVN